MDRIDFSSKHNVMIVNPEGTVQPMDEPYFRAIRIAPDTWQVLGDGDYFYVVAGEKEGMCIDCGYGAGNVREFAQKLCGKPVHSVANTNSRFEYAANDGYFDCAYMSQAAKRERSAPYPSFEGVEFVQDYPVEEIAEGFVFDLGGRKLETYSFPDQSDGSLAYLDRKAGILFVGNELSDFRKVLKSATLQEFEKQMSRLQDMRDSFHMVCAGDGIFYGDYIYKYLCNVRHILAGGQTIPMIREAAPSQTPERDQEGRIVYRRRAPHPQDVQLSMTQTDECRYLRFCKFADSKIVFDACMNPMEGGNPV